jgi:hypothetical protein
MLSGTPFQTHYFSENLVKVIIIAKIVTSATRWYIRN